ncbi:hypothetical protein lerEdw1_016304 [Lerista edwardsae]|nr:hypothetical protein lerEdw1_016304 [Lerista edwardsae]
MAHYAFAFKATISERCPNMDTWRYWNRHCYYFSHDPGKTWEEANATCSRFRAAELLWFDDEDDLEWSKGFIAERIWIGLQDINYDDEWAWSHEDDATNALQWIVLQETTRKKRCADLSPDGVVNFARCSEKKKWACKRPAEPDLDVYMGFWDTVVISGTVNVSSNSTHNDSRDDCIKQKSMCLGYGLWQSKYYLLNGAILVGGGFGPSVTFLKSASVRCINVDDIGLPVCKIIVYVNHLEHSEMLNITYFYYYFKACDYGYYGSGCEFRCPFCHWGKPCHPVTGMCEGAIVCASPQSVGTCSLGLYSLKCSLGSGWWYWQGQCYLIEKHRQVTWMEARELCQRFKHTRILHLENPEEKLWLQKKIQKQMWIGMKWHTEKHEWQWDNETTVDTKEDWLKIEGDTLEGCGTLLPGKPQLQSAKCQEKYYFICQRNEDMDIFQDFQGYIIPKREKVLPKIFYTLISAQEDCVFEKTTCTGVVSSQGQYYMVSGSTVFRSTNAGDTLYLKTVCNPGFYGTNCQFQCNWCENGLPCHGVTGECVGLDSTQCDLDSQDPKCDSEALVNPCPKQPNWHYYLKSCYYVEETYRDTWIVARDACQGYKGTDLVKITSSLEKVLVIRRNRRYTDSSFDCGVAFKNYLSVTDCFLKRKWICKREEGKLSPSNITCIIGCAAGRFGEKCEHTCTKCDDRSPCNPHTGLCADSVFCSNDDPTFTCEKGILIGRRCSAEDGWLYWHGSCYYVYNTEKNWLKARDTCRQFSDTDLLWLTSRDEKEWLLSKLPEGSFWTGLHGDKFCTHFQWSYNRVLYSAPEWLHKKWWKSITWTWRCCMRLSVPSGDTQRTGCYKKKPWICKTREEETLDFRIFDGYYLVGASRDPERVVHNSSLEAFQHCRFQGKLCSGIQRIKQDFITFLAQRLVRVNGSSLYLYTAFLKTACSLGYYGPSCEHLCTCNGTDECNPLNGECAENELCNEEYVASDCQEGVIHRKCPSDPGWWYWKNNCYYIEAVTLLPWDKANDFCSAYYGAKLLPAPSTLEEKNWLTSILKDFVWVGTEKAQTKDAHDL